MVIFILMLATTEICKLQQHGKAIHNGTSASANNLSHLNGSATLKSSTMTGLSKSNHAVEYSGKRRRVAEATLSGDSQLNRQMVKTSGKREQSSLSQTALVDIGAQQSTDLQTTA